ncbi:MAG TPA: DNA polymerase III subunit beta [Ktedonobacteraceae bacterium]|nr:DNA polymerase III subunit beta [Ktedonobacteraceae bacterium]
MYLTIAQQDLYHAVSLVSAIVGQGSLQMPILKQLRLDAEPGCLLVQAANEETRMRVRVPAVVRTPGTYLVPAQTFARFVGDLPTTSVTVQAPSPTDEDALHLRCQQINAHFKRGAFPLEEFPLGTLLSEGEELLTLDGALLTELIEQVAFAASNDASRPILEGMRLTLHHGSATCVAADTFRLSARSIPIPDQRASAEVLIPARVLRTLARVLPASDAVRLGRSHDGRHLLVQTRDLDLSSRLLEGVFPDVRSLLSLATPTGVVLPTQDLANAVHLMTAFARENKQQLRCTIEDAEVVLEAHAPDLGTNEMRLREAVTVSGPGRSFLINHHYLAEALAALPTPQVRLACGDARHPVVLQPVGPLDARHVIMPLTAQAPSAPMTARPDAPTRRAA